MSSNIVFFYRLYQGDNAKGRPSFYSKSLAFASFLQGYSILKCDKHLVLMLDGNELTSEYKRLAGSHLDDLYYLSGVGNCTAYLKLLDVIQMYRRYDYFYISEDDYLYTENAFVEMLRALNSIANIDYISLYDHPDRYNRHDNRSALKGDRIYLSGDWHWRTVESTCMTFGGHVTSFCKDLPTHRSFTINYSYPHDRDIWHRSLRLSSYTFKRKTLIAPIPSLATHMEQAYLAPSVDWQGIALEIKKKYFSAQS
jgi:hypothetical protein